MGRGLLFPSESHLQCSVQGPDAQYVVEFQFFLLPGKSFDKNDGGDSAYDESANGMYFVGSRANGDQPRKGSVVNETRIVFRYDQSHQYAARHSEQGVYGDKAGDAIEGCGGHHVESKPSDAKHPTAEGHERNTADGEGSAFPIGIPSAYARPQNDDRCESDPSTDGMYYHRTRIIMERNAP